MSGTATELLDLVARWVHVIAGIMWVGNSLLFNWLDRSLEKGSSAEGSTPSLGEGRQERGVALSEAKGSGLGHIWLLHSGGFYFVEKTLLAGEQLPNPLHWFKWQAYTTWLSGVALLLVVYYLGGRAVLADPTVASLSHAQAAYIGLGAIFAGWLLYESMNRIVAPRAPMFAAIVWMAGLIAISIALTRLLNGRAAFLHVGAMMGTIMAGNVFFTIVPSQRELVASVEQGQSAKLAGLSGRAKRVSIHNNYFAFPVIALMVSNHLPSIYGSRSSWLMLLILIAGGATVRYVLNVRFTEPLWRPALGFSIAVTILLLWGVLHVGGNAAPAVDASANIPVTFAEARHVIDRRCAACHSTAPSDLAFGAGPAGVTFDTPEQILARVPRINERAVVTRTMPPANKTNITDAERALLGRWIAQGARGR
jgi:uncharacterized membrane protein